MNKKTQHQVNILKDKILTYTDIINKLNENRKSIELQLSNNTNKESNDNTNTNTNTNINTNTNTNDTITIKELLNKKASLETHHQILKKNIFNISNEIKTYESDIAQLNIIYSTDISNEDIIIKEELSRIEEKKDNIIKQNNVNLELSYIDKTNLYNDIELIQNELELQNSKLLQIQII